MPLWLITRRHEDFFANFGGVIPVEYKEATEVKQKKVLGCPYIKLVQEGSPAMELPSINMLAVTLHIGAEAWFIRID
jgi:hypothetical protein